MISILMPIYNGIQFIDESVQSILDQTVDSWELLLGINGHPPESDVYTAAKFYETCPGSKNRIRVFDFPNLRSKSATLNAMIPLCRYDYVSLLDVDDAWHAKKLEVQLPYIVDTYPFHAYDVVGTRCVWFGDRPGVIPAIPIGDLTAFDFLQVNPIINSSVVLRKELAQWDESTLIEDYDLWLRLWRQGKRFYNCKEVVVKHRIHTQSAFNAKGVNSGNALQALLAKYRRSSADLDPARRT